MSVPDADGEDWVTQARPGPFLGLIGFVIAGAGLFAAMVWPQLYLFNFRPWGFIQHVVPVLITLMGFIAVPLGASVASGRLWAAMAVTPALALLLLLSLFWLVYTLSHGMFSPMNMIVPLGAGMGLVGAIVGVGLCARVHKARKALLAD